LVEESGWGGKDTARDVAAMIIPNRSPVVDAHFSDETQTATIHVLKVDGPKVSAAMAKQLHRRDIVEVFGI